MIPTVEATPTLLDLWESLPEPDEQATPLFQFVDGYQGWLVGVEGKRLVRVATGEAISRGA